jgi:hypothetical protein
VPLGDTARKKMAPPAGISTQVPVAGLPFGPVSRPEIPPGAWPARLGPGRGAGASCAASLAGRRTTAGIAVVLPARTRTRLARAGSAAPPDHRGR